MDLNTGYISEGKITRVGETVNIKNTSNVNITIAQEDLSKVFTYEGKPKQITYKGTTSKVEKGDIVSMYFTGLRGSALPTIISFRKWSDLDENDNPSLIRSDRPVYDYQLQLGASLFIVPPTSIKVDKITTTKRIGTIRSKGSIKSQTGHTDTRISLSLIFPNFEAVNDVDDGLRALIAQFKKTPFVPVVNRMLNFTHGIDSVCLHDLTINTIPHFPGCIKADLTLFAFDYSVFMPQEPSFIETIDADLYKFYYKDNIEKLASLTNNNSAISFKVLPESVLNSVKQTRMQNHGNNLNTVASNSESLDLANKDKSLLATALNGFKRAVKTKKRQTGRGWSCVPNPTINAEFRNSPDLTPEYWIGGWTGAGFQLYPVTVNYLLFLDIKHPDNKGVTDGFKQSGHGAGFNTCLVCNNKGSWSEAKVQLEKRIEDTVQAAKDRITKSEKDMTVSYGENLDGLMKKWEIEDNNIILTDVTVSMQNMFSRLAMQSNERPAYQFLGTEDAYIKLTFEVLGDSALIPHILTT
jgi:hypothetical protein